MKKTLGKKVELGMKLIPIPLSVLLAGTMAVTVQAEEVSSEIEGNQVQNNQATPPVNQELPNDGTIKNTPAEGPSGLTISEQGENGAAQVTPEIKQLAQEFYDYHTQEERDEITKAATMTSVMPEIQSVEQIEEAAKKYDHAYAIRKMDGVFKYIDLKQIENLNAVKDEDFKKVPSKRVSSWDSFIQNNTALFFLSKWESMFNPNPRPEEEAKIPKAIIPRSELDLTVEETFPTKRFLQMKVWEHSGLTFEEAFSRKYLPESDNRVLSLKEIKQIILTNPNLFQIQAISEEFIYYMNPFFQKLLISGKEAGDEYTDWKGKNLSFVDSRDNFAQNHIYFYSFDYNTIYPIGNEFWGIYRGLYNGAIDDVADNILRKYNLYEKPFVHIDWLGKNPSLERPWFGKDNIKTFHYRLYLLKPNDKTRYYIDRDYRIDIAGVPNIAETPDGGFKFVNETIPGGGQTTIGYKPDQGELDKLFRTVKADGFVFKLSDVKKVREGETGPGKVLVRYQDEQGNAIANPITDEQPGKTRYTVSPKPLISYKNQLYTYKSRLANTYDESGEYEAGLTKEIVYVYMRNQFQLPNDAPSEDKPVMEVTRFVDQRGQELSAPEQGLVVAKSIVGYEFQSSNDEDGIRTHVYRASVHEVPKDAPVEDKPSIEMTRFVDVEGRPLAAAEFGLLDAKAIEEYGFVSVSDANGVRTYVYKPKTHTQTALGTETSEQRSPVKVENSETTPVLSRVSKHQLPNTGNKNSSFLGATVISFLASFGLLHSKKERKK